MKLRLLTTIIVAIVASVSLSIINPATASANGGNCATVNIGAPYSVQRSSGVLASVAVPAEYAGWDVHSAGAGGSNNESIHPGNNIVITSPGGAGQITLVDVESEAGGYVDGTISQLGSELVATLQLGADGVFSGGFSAWVKVCQPAPEPVKPSLSLSLVADCDVITATVNSGEGDINIDYTIVMPGDQNETGSLEPNSSAVHSVNSANWWGQTVTVSVGTGNKGGAEEISVPSSDICDPPPPPEPNPSATVEYSGVCDVFVAHAQLSNGGDADSLFTIEIGDPSTPNIGSALAAVNVAPGQTEIFEIGLNLGDNPVVISASGMETLSTSILAEACPPPVDDTPPPVDDTPPPVIPDGDHFEPLVSAAQNAGEAGGSLVPMLAFVIFAVMTKFVYVPLRRTVR